MNKKGMEEGGTKCETGNVELGTLVQRSSSTQSYF